MIEKIVKGTNYTGNLKNVIQGQRPDMENRHTQKRK